MTLAIFSGVLGMLLVWRSLSTNQLVFAVFGVGLILAGVFEMVRLDFHFPWLFVYCAALLVITLFIARPKRIKSRS